MPAFSLQSFRSPLLLAALVAAGCSGNAELPINPGATYTPPPSSTVVEDGKVRIRREVFLVPGVSPPPNPVTGGQTPAGNNNVRVIRYRVDAYPPRPARAIAVLMPGFLGGGPSFDSLARAVVRRSTDADALEVWAIDRRSNLLEDHHGLDVAEVEKDPEIAKRYYFEDATVEGKNFQGFVSQSQVDYMSEWGLVTTLGDLRKVIEQVDTTERKKRIFLIGHSLGASIVEEYAAWDFDGKPGYAELAGLGLIDGVSGQEGAASPSLTEDQYHNGTGPGPGGFSPPGLDEIRKTTRFISLPFLGQKVYPIAAVCGMRAVFAPSAIAEDPYRDSALSVLLGLDTLPRMTNRAAMGFSFDNGSNGLSFASVSCGAGKGGAITEYDSLLGGKLVHPSDPSATYDWTEYDATNPPEHTSLDDISRSWFEGPGLDFSEWYFPARLSLDAQAAGTLVLKAGDWPYDKQDMRAMHGATMDLPILGAVAGLVGDTKALDALRKLVADVAIGPDRPLAGKPRTDPDAFAVIDITQLTHIDPLAGTDKGSGVVPKWYDSLASWMTKNSPTGGVVIAAPKP
jgi:pimeloyl-ACP methyl ester carboxylesterase